MAASFSFVRNNSTDAFVSWAHATEGAGLFGGIDNPSVDHLVATGNLVSNDDFLLVPIALNDGQSVSLDVDFGVGASDSVDTQLYVLDADGALVATNSSGGTDLGSTSGLDPKLIFTATQAGLYYVAVSQGTTTTSAISASPATAPTPATSSSTWRSAGCRRRPYGPMALIVARL